MERFLSRSMTEDIPLFTVLIENGEEMVNIELIHIDEN